MVSATESGLPVIHALWVGKNLGKISRCCLRSFALRGHKVLLHAYEEIGDLPDGVQQVDANEIIHNSKIFRHNRTGSYALFSDVFRYELLARTGGIYVDCDVYCLRPTLIPETGYLLGREQDNLINGAVLALPPSSQLLASLLDAAYNPYFIPPWYKKYKKRLLRAKKFLGAGKHVSDMPWGVIGPAAITYFSGLLDLAEYVQPIDVFYPVHYSCVGQLLDPALKIEDLTSSRTQCVHLYNEMLRKMDLEKIPAGCVLAKMIDNEV